MCLQVDVRDGSESLSSLTVAPLTVAELWKILGKSACEREGNCEQREREKDKNLRECEYRHTFRSVDGHWFSNIRNFMWDVLIDVDVEGNV